MKVGPCISTPTVSATSAVVSAADIVIYPPVNDLPKHNMSGETPACSQPKSFPVRPKPVAPKPRPYVAPKPKPVATTSPRPTPPPVAKPKPKANNDINAMLGKIRSKPAGAPAAGTPSPSAALLPEKPSVRQIKQVVGKMRPQVTACYRRLNPGGGSASIKARVSVKGSSGSVSKVEVLTAPYAMNQTGSCIVGVLRGMRFEPFRKTTHTFQIPFMVR